MSSSENLDYPEPEKENGEPHLESSVEAVAWAWGILVIHVASVGSLASFSSHLFPYFPSAHPSPP